MRIKRSSLNDSNLVHSTSAGLTRSSAHQFRTHHSFSHHKSGKDISSPASHSVSSSSHKKSSLSKKLFLCIIVFLLIIMLVELWVLFEQDSALKLLDKKYSSSLIKIDSLNTEIDSLNKSNASLLSELNSLNTDYSDLSKANSSLSTSYSSLKSEAVATLDKIDKYENEIQGALDWFKTNSILVSGSGADVDLRANCLKINSDSCEVNLGCFHLVNSEFLSLQYKSDLMTSNSVDKLQSLDGFLRNSGGDCEDFALFYKAEFNSIAKKCVGKKISLFAWVDSKGYIFWANYSSSWYLNDAKQKFLSSENLFPVIVCGSMFDLRSGSVNGHCVVAFSPSKISSAEDIAWLNSAELIEPQNGEYLLMF
ncbi:MAG: hypothetical protein NTY48_06915 [Candidatus Diapherotrites archaeon]|nr:hypothetical protein [Candidatus Diapherotrites archaeon]